jgi:hypothetical protein
VGVIHVSGGAGVSVSEYSGPVQEIEREIEEHPSRGAASGLTRSDIRSRGNHVQVSDIVSNEDTR